MLVSVIIPCYNGEKYLKKCVDCVVNQTYKNVEIIIVDDKSKDNSVNLIKELEKNIKNPKIIPVISKTNNGPGGAKNEGLKFANGDYVMFLDCDDTIDSDYIENMLQGVTKKNKIDVVAAGLKKVSSDGNILYTRIFKDSENILWQNISSSGKLYNREWLEKNNITLPYGKVLEDIMFQAAIILNKPNFKCKELAGYNYIVNPTSISHTTLTTFKQGSIEKEQEYLISLKRFVKSDEDLEILTYFAFRTMIWHLLKSGCKVGKQAMEIEYNKAFKFLKEEFPDFKKNKYLKLFRKTKDRKIIKKVLSGTNILYKIKLSKIFFKIYGRIDLSKLWPNM